jgi:hypothetical protein
MFHVDYNLQKGTRSSWERPFSIKRGGTILAHVVPTMAHCCGANALESMCYMLALGDTDVRALITWMKTQPWGVVGQTPAVTPAATTVGNTYDKTPLWYIKHLFFFQDVRSETRGWALLQAPEVKRVFTYPSASEPGHDIGMYLLDLS